MITLATSSDGKQEYVVFERSREVQNLSMREVGYFKRALGMSDYVASFCSWIGRQGPVLIGCVSEAQLLGWCMFERWERSDRDRSPIFLLRTIEVGTRHRGQGIGRHLMELVFRLAPGHLIVHPLSDPAQQFFEYLGFIQAPAVLREEMRDRYGYSVLPSAAKHDLILGPPEGLVLHAAELERFTDGLSADVLQRELKEAKSFAQAFASAIQGDSIGALAQGARRPIKRVTNRVPCACGSVEGQFSVGGDGSEFLSAECSRCGRTWITIPL
jgi:GNAT superfamily N-acetyltransferase